MLVSLFGINFLFGTTWVFAVFTFSVTNADVSFASQLMFVLCNALQGFLIFFFFVLLNSDARQAWKNFLCPYKKKKKPHSITSTSDKFPVKSNTGSSSGTFSSSLPSYQIATLEKNVHKSEKQSHELLTSSNPTILEEDEVETAAVQMEPPLDSSPAKAVPKVAMNQSEEIEGVIQKGGFVRETIQRQSTTSHIHDIETFEVEFGLSSSETLDDGNL